MLLNLKSQQFKALEKKEKFIEQCYSLLPFILQLCLTQYKLGQLQPLVRLGLLDAEKAMWEEMKLSMKYQHRLGGVKEVGQTPGIYLGLV